MFKGSAVLVLQEAESGFLGRFPENGFVCGSVSFEFCAWEFFPTVGLLVGS